MGGDWGWGVPGRGKGVALRLCVRRRLPKAACVVAADGMCAGMTLSPSSKLKPSSLYTFPKLFRAGGFCNPS